MIFLMQQLLEIKIIHYWMSSRKTLPKEDDLLDAERVLLNPLNRSPSKQQYSFARAQRFDRCYTQNDSYRFYDLPSTRSRIATSIGREQRDSRTASPSPLCYNYAKDGEFALLLRARNRGFTFRLGRQEVKVNSFLTANRSSSPDPGAYDPQQPGLKQKSQFSFSKAKKDTTSALKLPVIPGPGTYKVDTSLQEQKQFLSIHPKAASPKIVELKVENRRRGKLRYPPLCKLTLHADHPKTTAKGEPLEFSRLNKGPIITSSQRTPMATSANPGPGQYKMFSEFIGKGKC